MVFVDAVQVWSGLPAGLDDPEAVADEVLGLLSESQIGVGQAERPHAPLGERLALSRAPADPVVLAQHHPVVACRQGDPPVILDVLSCLLAVDLGQGAHDQPGLTQRSRERDTTETAVDEEFRRLAAAALPTG